MKKLLALAVAMLAVTPVYALDDPTSTFETTQVTSTTYGVSGLSTGSEISGSMLLYGWQVKATANAGWCAIYAVDTVGEISSAQGVLIEEVAIATASNTWNSDWPEPYRLTGGLSVVCAGAIVTLYHEPI
jgi:hypothetical protein